MLCEKKISKSRVFCSYWADTNGKRLAKFAQDKTIYSPGERVRTISKILGTFNPDTDTLFFHFYEDDAFSMDEILDPVRGHYDEKIKAFYYDWKIVSVKDEKNLLHETSAEIICEGQL